MIPVPLRDYDSDFAYPYLESISARSCGRWSADQLEHEILSRERQLWLVPGGVVLTRSTEDGVYVDAVTGENADEWRDEMLDTVIAWAREQGLSRVFSMVRPGWSRWAKQRGALELHREMVLEV